MSKKLIDTLANSDNVGAETVFKDIMVQKVGNALETKRQQLSKDFVKSKTEEENVEVW
mgnify:FL=1